MMSTPKLLHDTSADRSTKPTSAVSYPAVSPTSRYICCHDICTREVAGDQQKAQSNKASALGQQQRQQCSKPTHTNSCQEK